MRTIRVNADNMPWDGLEVNVEDDATDDEIYQACWDEVAQYVDFGWEEVK